MIGSNLLKITRRTLTLLLLASLCLPLTTLASPKKGQGRGRDKKNEKFINGHDARDGRYDGRGPKRDRDDDDDDYRRERRRRDRNRDGGWDRGEFRREAQSIGYREGYEEGRSDRANGEDFDYRHSDAYRDATAGYRDQYGNIEAYRNYFREGFRRGYENGYRERAERNSAGGLGGILGGILGN